MQSAVLLLVADKVPGNMGDNQNHLLEQENNVLTVLDNQYAHA